MAEIASFSNVRSSRRTDNYEVEAKGAVRLRRSQKIERSPKERRQGHVTRLVEKDNVERSRRSKDSVDFFFPLLSITKGEQLLL